MGEFRGGHEEPTTKPEEEKDPESGRHEKTAREAVDVLRAAGYFHPGESAEIAVPDPGRPEKWAVRCDLRALLDSPPDPERQKRFPSADPLHDAFVAAGYRVDVWPDYESADPEIFHVKYFLYEKEK